MGKTSIEWTATVHADGTVTPGETWNPTRGCSIESPGCTNCYAMRTAHRFSGEGGTYEGLTRMTNHGPVWTGEVRTIADTLDAPLRWRKPRRVFVNSMSDLFHESIPDADIEAVFGVMHVAGRHTFQILTKRAARMREFVTKTSMERCLAEFTVRVGDGVIRDESPSGRSRSKSMPAGWEWPPPNVHLGVSVENQKYADERVPDLVATPAAVRFLSVEPMLGPVTLFGMPAADDTGPIGPAWRQRAVEHRTDYGTGVEHDVALEAGIDWVIVGGESGPGARPMHEDWVRSLRDESTAAGVAFFYKQRLDERKRKVSLPLLDGRQWAEFPAVRT